MALSGKGLLAEWDDSKVGTIDEWGTGLEQGSTLGEPICLRASTWIGIVLICVILASNLLWFLINP